MNLKAKYIKISNFNLNNALSIYFMVILSVILPNVGKAQEKIDLSSAIDLALKNNATIGLENLKIQLANIQQGSNKNIPKTNLGTEIGQINTNLIDSKFGISQNISLPIVYKKQKEVLTSYYTIAQSEKEIKAFEIKKNIHLIFNNYAFLQAKNLLLLEIDSLYATYEKKAIIRFNSGESNLLEKTLGEQQRQNVIIQQMGLNQEIKDLNLALKYILNYKANIEPLVTTGFRSRQTEISDSFSLQHPLILNLQEIEKLEKAKSALTKAQQKPELMFGLNNTSFSGPAANVADKSYSNINRFSSVQFGISIPLNANYYKKINEANSLSEKIAETNTRNQTQNLTQNLDILKSQYKTKWKAKTYFDTVRIPNALQIIMLAEKRYASGEINFIDLTTYLTQVYNTKAEYLDLINILNMLDIEMQFLN